MNERSENTHADRILLLNSGQVEVEGTADQLLERSESFRMLWYGEESAD